MVIACIFCSAQHSLAELKKYSDFSSAVMSVLRSFIGCELVEKIPAKYVYVCIDCVILIHNSGLFLKVAKRSVQKMTNKHLNDAGNIESKEELDRIKDDLAIISNWIKSQTEYLKKLDTHAECATQTEKSSSASLRDAIVQTEKSSTKKHHGHSQKSNSTASKETVAIKNGVESTFDSTQKKRKWESDAVSLTNSHSSKKKAKTEAVKEEDKATRKKDKESNAKASMNKETARSNSASASKSSKTNELAIAVKTPQDIQLKQTASPLFLEKISQSAEEEAVTGLLTPASEKSSKKKHHGQIGKSNSTASKETVAIKNGVESTAESTQKKRKKERDAVSLTNSHSSKKNAKTEPFKEKDHDTLKIRNKEKKDKATPKKDKESSTTASMNKETAKSNSVSSRKISKSNELAIAVKTPLDIQLKQTAETLCLEMPPQSAEEEAVTGLLTPASESLLDTDDNRESVECKIDIVEADLKAELISPSNQIAVESPVLYNSPKSNQLFEVKKTVEVLKVCSLCEHTMYSANEIRRHRLQHMQCNYCKKKFRSLKSTYIHSTYECKQNPLMCRVSLMKIDSWKKLCDDYPTAFSQLRDG